MTTEETELTFIRCPSCRSLIPAIATRCRMCGAQFEKNAAPQEEAAAAQDPYEAQRKSRVRQRTISASPDEVDQIKRQAASESPGSEEPPFRVGGQGRREEPVAERLTRQPEPPRFAEPEEEDAGNGFDLPESNEPEEEPAFEPPSNGRRGQQHAAPHTVQHTVQHVAPEEPPAHEEDWSEDHGTDTFEDSGEEGDDDDSEDSSQQESDRPAGKKRRRRRRRKRSNANLTAENASGDGAQTRSNDDAPQHEDDHREPEPREAAPREFAPRESAQRPVAPQPAPIEPPPARPVVETAPPVRTPEPIEPVRAEPARPEPIRQEPPRREPERARPEPIRSEPFQQSSEEHVSRSDGDLIGWLVNFSTNNRGGGTELRGGRFFVGRQKLRDHDLVLTDSSISTPHCIVTASAEGLLVQDLMSERGTHLKKSGSDSYSAVSNPVPVEHGDWLKFGEYEVLICLVPQRGKSRR